MPGFPDPVSAPNICSRSYIGTAFAPPPGLSQVGNWTEYMNSVSGNLRLSVNGGPFIDFFGPGGIIVPPGSGGSLGDGYNTATTGAALSGNGRIILANAGAVRVNKSSGDGNNAFEVDVTGGTGIAARFTGATISCPHTGGSSERFGQGASATALSCTAIGNNALAAALAATAMGQNAAATAASCTAVGQSCVANAASCTAIGASASAQIGTSTAVGAGATANSGGSTAIGQGATANFGSNTIVGSAASATGVQGTAVGFACSAGQIAVAVGFAANAFGQNSVAIGQTSSAGEDNTAVGQNALSTFFQGASTSVGWLANSNALGATAIGGNTLASALGTVALGQGAIASAIRAIAIGRVALASAVSSIAIGAGAVASAPGQCVIGAAASVVSDFRIIGTPQVGLGVAAGVYGGAVGVVLSMPVVIVAPAGATAGVGIIFVDAAGGLSFKGAAGTVTAIAPS